MIHQFVDVKSSIGDEMDDPFGIWTLLSNVFQEVLSIQLLQKAIQIFFVSDEMRHFHETVVVLTGMEVTEFPRLDVPQDESKRQIDFEAGSLLSEDLVNHLSEVFNGQIVYGEVIPILHSVVGVILVTDRLPVLKIQCSGIRILR